jgi:hypothetical protein
MLVMAFSYGTTISYLANLEPTLKTVGYKNSGRVSAYVVLSAMLSGIVSLFALVKKLKQTS